LNNREAVNEDTNTSRLDGGSGERGREREREKERERERERERESWRRKARTILAIAKSCTSAALAKMFSNFRDECFNVCDIFI
jgi:hypothetical protein